MSSYRLVFKETHKTISRLKPYPLAINSRHVRVVSLSICELSDSSEILM